MTNDENLKRPMVKRMDNRTLRTGKCVRGQTSPRPKNKMVKELPLIRSNSEGRYNVPKTQENSNEKFQRKKKQRNKFEFLVCGISVSVSLDGGRKRRGNGDSTTTEGYDRYVCWRHGVVVDDDVEGEQNTTQYLKPTTCGEKDVEDDSQSYETYLSDYHVTIMHSSNLTTKKVPLNLYLPSFCRRDKLDKRTSNPLALMSDEEYSFQNLGKAGSDGEDSFDFDSYSQDSSFSDADSNTVRAEKPKLPIVCPTSPTVQMHPVCDSSKRDNGDGEVLSRVITGCRYHRDASFSNKNNNDKRDQPLMTSTILETIIERENDSDDSCRNSGVVDRLVIRGGGGTGNNHAHRATTTTMTTLPRPSSLCLNKTASETGNATTVTTATDLLSVDLLTQMSAREDCDDREEESERRTLRNNNSQYLSSPGLSDVVISIDETNTEISAFDPHQTNNDNDEQQPREVREQGCDGAPSARDSSSRGASACARTGAMRDDVEDLATLSNHHDDDFSSILKSFTKYGSTANNQRDEDKLLDKLLDNTITIATTSGAGGALDALHKSRHRILAINSSLSCPSANWGTADTQASK